jgi:hypothetical protein
MEPETLVSTARNFWRQVNDMIKFILCTLRNEDYFTLLPPYWCQRQCHRLHKLLVGELTAEADAYSRNAIGSRGHGTSLIGGTLLCNIGREARSARH